MELAYQRIPYLRRIRANNDTYTPFYKSGHKTGAPWKRTYFHAKQHYCKVDDSAEGGAVQQLIIPLDHNDFSAGPVLPADRYSCEDEATADSSSCDAVSLFLQLDTTRAFLEQRALQTFLPRQSSYQYPGVLLYRVRISSATDVAFVGDGRHIIAASFSEAKLFVYEYLLDELHPQNSYLQLVSTVEASHHIDLMDYDPKTRTVVVSLLRKGTQQFFRLVYTRYGESNSEKESKSKNSVSV